MQLPDITDWLSELVDNLDDEVFVHSIDGAPYYANAVCLKRLGLSLEEFRALPPYGWVPEASRPELPHRIEQLSMHGHGRFESPYTGPAGENCTYEIRAKVLSLEGSPVVLAVGRDVTGRAHMMEDLQLRSALLDLVEDAIVVHDPDGTILYVNNAAAAMHGYRKHRMMQLNIHSLSLDPPAETPQLSREADTAFAVDHLTATGTLLHLRVVARLVEHRGSEIVVRVMRREERWGRPEAPSGDEVCLVERRTAAGLAD